MLGTQRYLHQEIEAGLERDIHDFVVLKGGRQIGGSTYLDIRIPFHLQMHRGLVGIMVSDDEPNRDYRRDVMLDMLNGMPKSYRWPVRLSNKNVLAWGAPNHSRLLFDYAGIREGSNLGRSRGVNVGYLDEVGSWPEQQAVSALRASFSKSHPKRLYVWVSTARGFNVFRDMWESAKTATSTKPIFVAWWRREDFRVERDSPQWMQYRGEPTRDEWHWMDVVKRRYDVEIAPEQLFWHRWMLAEEFYGDEAMMGQEYGCIEEECFQAFGSKFVAPHIIRRMRERISDDPLPKCYRYEWAATLDDTRPMQIDPLTAPDLGVLRVWEDPDPRGVYIIAGHPWGSSTPAAMMYCAQVWRAFPDALEQVAEYSSIDGNGFQFAWLIAALGGLYRQPNIIPYEIIDIGGAGLQTLEELDRIRSYGYGIAPAARADMLDITSSVHRYVFRRSDSLRGTRGALQMDTSSRNERQRMLLGMRDEIERQHLLPRSRWMLDEFAMLRRGEFGDNDQIGAGGAALDARAMTCALAVEHWLKNAMHDTEFMVVAPRHPGAPKRAEEVMLGNFMRRAVLRQR